MISNKEILEQENKLIDTEGIINFFLRRKKIISITSSFLFAILFINSVYNYIKRPVYMGSFSILIEDPIDVSNKINTIEGRVALNQFSYKIPTLIQYLKSEFVLNPVAEEIGINKQALNRKIEIRLAGEGVFLSRGILEVIVKDGSKIRNSRIMEKLSSRYLEAASEQKKIILNSGLEFLNSEMPIIEAKNKLIKKNIEEFRTKYNIIEPLKEAQTLESQKLAVDLQISEYLSNLRRLDLIKKDIISKEFYIKGFVEELSNLGFNFISSDLQLINQYLELEGELADAKTKYRPNSKVLKSIEKRLESLYPEIQKKQLESIELAIKLNNSQIELQEKKLDVISDRFKLQPNILSKYEKLLSELSNAEKNYTSLLNAKDNLRLELAQKSLPWRIIENPNVNSQPISPNVKEESIKNILISLLIGISLAYTREQFDNVFHNDNELERILKPFNIPVLGSFPFIKKLSDEEDTKDTANEFLISESLRNFATSLRFLNINNQETNIFLITSTKQSEGKTTLTSLLAQTLSDLGQKVLLVDGDMRRPALHKFFKIDNIIGLTNLITDTKLNFKNIVKKTNFNNLDILTAGIRPPDPVFLLSSQRMKLIINELKNEDYDVIVIDAPPSQGLADAQLISTFSDLVLYVVNMEDVNKNHFRKTINKFTDKNNFALATVSNRCKIPTYTYGDYGNNYYYSENLYKYYEKVEDPKNEETQSEENRTLKVKFQTVFKNFNKSSIKEYIKRFMKWIDF